MNSLQNFDALKIRRFGNPPVNTRSRGAYCNLCTRIFYEAKNIKDSASVTKGGTIRSLSHFPL